MILCKPVLLFAGEYDLGLSPRNATERARLFGHAELAVQPGARRIFWNPWRAWPPSRQSTPLRGPSLA